MQDFSNSALTEAVYYILLSLKNPLHGYGIMQHVEKISKGRVRLAAGTLYGAINSLLEKNWVKALSNSEDSRKKDYQITDLGLNALHQEIERLQELVKNGLDMLQENNDEKDNL
jgi:DNA-binding PadR family transcriptional regulator